jgi:hypothetical protein
MKMVNSLYLVVNCSSLYSWYSTFYYVYPLEILHSLCSSLVVTISSAAIAFRHHFETLSRMTTADFRYFILRPTMLLGLILIN